MEKTTKEFKIEIASQVDDVINGIKENFAKEDIAQENIVVRFDDNISVEDLLESLKKLWQYELDSNKSIDIIIKNLSYEHRKSALGCALKTPTITDHIFLMNIFCLIKGYNTFDESYFEHEQVFLNDEVEFLDIFDDLEQEIKEVTLKTAEYYMSMLKTCNLVEAVENNPNAIKMENLYVYLFDSMDVTILAKILSTPYVVKETSIWETKKIVLNSLGYLAMIAEKFVFTNTMMSLIGKTIMEKSIQDSFESKPEE